MRRNRLRWARENGAKTVLDPRRLSASDTCSDGGVLKPNGAEAGVLTGARVEDRQSARAAARKLLARGVGAVAIAAGDEGNLLVTVDGEHWMPRIKVNAVDATGAGDAFAGTLATYLARGRTLVEAATFANAAAALKTTKMGAQAGLPRRKRFWRSSGGKSVGSRQPSVVSRQSQSSVNRQSAVVATEDYLMIATETDDDDYDYDSTPSQRYRFACP